MKGIIDFITELDTDDFGMFFVGFPLTVLLILGIVGGIEAGVVGLHVWSVAVFVTIAYYLIGGATALSLNVVAQASKTTNHFMRNVGFYFALFGFVLTVITCLITLWQIHWILGGVVTLVGLILGTGLVISMIIASKKEESE